MNQSKPNQEQGWEKKLDEFLGLHQENEVSVIFGKYGMRMEDNRQLHNLKRFTHSTHQDLLSRILEEIKTLPSWKVSPEILLDDVLFLLKKYKEEV